MKRRIPISLLLACAIAIGCGFYFFRAFRTSGRPELSYLGQPAEVWFAKLPITIVGAGARGWVNALGQRYGPTNISGISGVEAFDAMGTNALPYLLSKLTGKDSIAEKAVEKAAQTVQAKSVPFRNADNERMQAVTALIDIKQLPPAAENQLRQLSTNSPSSDVAEAARYILECRANGTKFFTPGQP